MYIIEVLVSIQNFADDRISSRVLLELDFLFRASGKDRVVLR